MKILLVQNKKDDMAYLLCMQNSPNFASEELNNSILYKAKTANEAIKKIESNSNVWLHSAGAAPTTLIRALTDRASELKNVNIYQLHTEGAAPYADEKYKDSFKVNAFFIGKNVRENINSGRGSFIPSFLSEVPIMFRRGVIPLDTALINVSPPDRHGFCSLGISVEATRAAIDSAEHVVAQINPCMPRTHGDGLIHIKEFDSLVEVNDPLPELNPRPLTDLEMKIGQNVASIVEDDATLQMGIGSIPDAVLKNLVGHKNLGVHTEMFSDGLIDLVEKGVVTGNRKTKHRGTVVTGFLVGSKRLYDFVDDNPFVRVLDIQYINKTSVIQSYPKMTSINSAIEIDLTGQVCADSIGMRMYSGVGGQMDFIRGASLSEGGKPIIALPSITSKGISRIVPTLKEGAGVVTTRAHVHYVVTENGVASLYGKTLKQRAKALIEISHPDKREELIKAAFDRFGSLA